MRIVTLLTALSAVACGGGGMADPGGATSRPPGWQEPVVVAHAGAFPRDSYDGVYPLNPELALSPALDALFFVHRPPLGGGATLVWVERVSGAPWSAPVALSIPLDRRNAVGVDVAVAPDGTAVVTWRDIPEIGEWWNTTVATRGADGRWGPPQKVNVHQDRVGYGSLRGRGLGWPPGAHVVAGEGGRSTAFWTESYPGDSLLLVRRALSLSTRRPGSVFGPSEWVDDDVAGITFERNGDRALVAWRNPSDDVLTVGLCTAGEPCLFERPAIAGSVRPAIAGNHALLATKEVVATHDGTGPWRLETAPGTGDLAALAIAADGRASIVWWQSSILSLQERPPGGSWTPPRRIAEAVGSTAACITDRGETIVLWTSWDGDGILLGSSGGGSRRVAMGSRAAAPQITCGDDGRGILHFTREVAGGDTEVVVVDYVPTD